MVLHICSITAFNLKMIIDIFEEANPGGNNYFIGYYKNYKKLDDEICKNTNVVIAPYVKDITKVLDMQKYNTIFVHGLWRHHAKIVNHLKGNKKIIWVNWGAEIYSFFQPFKKDLYQPMTKKYFNTQIKRPNINEIYYNLIKRPRKNIQKAFSNIDFFAASAIEEYDLIKNHLQFKFKFSWFCYYPIDIMFDINKPHKTDNDVNILVGNSNAPENNHLDTFELLKGFKIGNRNIIVPLSYGGTESYKSYVVKRGKKLFNKSFQPLQTWIPLEEYNNILLSCNIVIMNHNRQQAFGNILSSLWLGAKVFINPKSVIFTYLKRIGLTIYSTGDLKNKYNLGILQPLTENDKQKNRTIVLSEFGIKNIKNKLKNLL